MRMHKVLFYIIFLLAASGFSQDYHNVDEKVRNYPHFKAVTDLGYRIMNDFDDDPDRVRAAFIWLTHNMTYGKPRRAVQQRIKNDRQGDMEVELSRMERAFLTRRGVCIDYSLLLDKLCRQFRLPSRVIIGVAKTEIKQVRGEPMFKNHSWNTVQIQGVWKLMDPTWASGHVDLSSKRFVRKYMDHYFFTSPADFVKHHLPALPEWQLLQSPVDARTFFSGPMYYPEYFGKGIALSSNTSGIIKVSTSRHKILYFDELPRFHGMYYTINNSPYLKKMGFRKASDKAYFSRLHLKRKLNKATNYLTIFHEEQPILNFKLEE